jgi:GNAT superfamily N-acetyltransferase
MIFGVVPEHQGKGVESAILLRFEKEIKEKGFPYSDLEMNWIGDFNPVMMKFVEQIGGKIYKTHVTYRYLFDRSKEFKRADLSF